LRSIAPTVYTLPFPRPRLVPTTFCRPRAVFPPTPSTMTETATKYLRNMTILLDRRGGLPRHIAATGPNHQVLLSGAHDQRMPSRNAARFERDQILMPQLVHDLVRRGAALCRRAGHEGMATGPGREIRQRSAQCRLGDRVGRWL